MAVKRSFHVTGLRRRWLAALFAGCLMVIIGAVAASGEVGQPGGFRSWLTDVRSGDGDRGWSHLGDGIRNAYDGDLDAYRADVTAVDWSLLRLGPPVDVWRDDGFVRVEAPLLSPPHTVPRFLIERRIVHGVCDQGGRPIGIGVYEDRRPFAWNRFEAGGVTGGQARCNAAFATD